LKIYESPGLLRPVSVRWNPALQGRRHPAGNAHHGGARNGFGGE